MAYEIPLIPNRGDLYTSGIEYLPQEKTQAFTSLMDFLRNPLSNVGQAVQPLIEALGPSEGLARRNLQDEFRKAGALQDTSFASEARKLEGDILTKRGQTAAAAGLQYLAPLIQGRVGALSGIPSLRQTIGSQGAALNNNGGGGFNNLNFPQFGSSADEIASANLRNASNPHFMGYGSGTPTYNSTPTLNNVLSGIGGNWLSSSQELARANQRNSMNPNFGGYQDHDTYEYYGDYSNPGYSNVMEF